MALTNWNDILNKPRGIDEVPEIALTVEQLSASVLSLGEDLGEVAGDVQEIALEVSQLSASNLPYSISQSTKQKIDEVNGNIPTKTSELTNDNNFIELYTTSWGTTLTVKQSMCTLIFYGTTVRGVQIYSYNSYNNTITSVSATDTLTATKNEDDTVTFTVPTTGYISALVM